MKKEDIENKANELFGENPFVYNAFVKGAECVTDYLCRIPIDRILIELHELCKEKNERECTHEKGRNI